MTHDIQAAIESTRQQLRQHEKAYNRVPESVALMAVSKTKPVTMLQQAIDCGQRHFGENYLDEALLKMEALAEADCVWHFIGAIQSNKTAKIAAGFDWVHSIDRGKIARRLSEQRPQHLPSLNCCIQLNVDEEASKAGIMPDDLPELCELIDGLPGLTLRGLMCIPAPRQELADQRAVFAIIADYHQQMAKRFNSMDTLSIGMSGDIEAAVAEGSTMVRVGTAIFGARA